MNKKEITSSVFGFSGVTLDEIVTAISIDDNIGLEQHDTTRRLMEEYGVELAVSMIGAFQIAQYGAAVAVGKVTDHFLSKLPNYQNNYPLKLASSAAKIIPKFFIYSPLHLGLEHYYGAATWMTELPSQVHKIFSYINLYTYI